MSRVEVGDSTGKAPTAPPRKPRPKPYLNAAYCKGCGRCIPACSKDCLVLDGEVLPESGLVPVTLSLENCNACGLCVLACPEPYALLLEAPQAESAGEVLPVDQPIVRVPLPQLEPMLMKGTHASAIGALLAGCRHFFGYPITPSSEGAELMSKLLPHLDGVFLQAISEVATVNHMYGCGGAGVRCMTLTSSPGFSLMLEGISYMIGAEIPGVFVDVMRAGPGLGNIGPAQADIRLACQGLGHGDTHAVVLAPADPQEMLDLTILAFDLAFRYRNPVIILGDGHLGQVTGKVRLPDHMVQPGIPAWAVHGDRMHRRNLHSSIRLDEGDQERFNEHLFVKYEEMTREEQRAEPFQCDDAELVFVAVGTPARIVKGAVRTLRGRGVKAGLFRPISLWPFPVRAWVDAMATARRVIFVEASGGQLEDEARLALSHAGSADGLLFEHVRRTGGNLPETGEILGAAEGRSS